MLLKWIIPFIFLHFLFDLIYFYYIFSVTGYYLKTYLSEYKDMKNTMAHWCILNEEEKAKISSDHSEVIN